MVDYFKAKGGEFRYNSRVQKILLGSDGRVDGFQLANGSTVKADLYVSAMPGAIRQLPSTCPSYFGTSTLFDEFLSKFTQTH